MGETDAIDIAGRIALDDQGGAVGLAHVDARPVGVEQLDVQLGRRVRGEERRVGSIGERGGGDRVRDLGDRRVLDDDVVGRRHVDERRRQPVGEAERERVRGRVVPHVGAAENQPRVARVQRQRHGFARRGRLGEGHRVAIGDPVNAREGVLLEHGGVAIGLDEPQPGLVVVEHLRLHVADRHVVEARVGAPAARADHDQPVALGGSVVDGLDDDRLGRAHRRARGELHHRRRPERHAAIDGDENGIGAAGGRLGR